MKSCAILTCPAWYINHPFVQVSCPLVTQKPSPTKLTVEVSEPQSSDTGNSNMPKRSDNVLSLSEKVEVLDLVRKKS